MSEIEARLNRMRQAKRIIEGKNTSNDSCRIIEDRIGASPRLMREAEAACNNQQVKEEIDNIIAKLQNGHPNPGVKRKRVNGGKGIIEHRGINGGRVYVFERPDKIQILGKSGKNNQKRIIEE